MPKKKSTKRVAKKTSNDKKPKDFTGRLGKWLQGGKVQDILNPPKKQKKKK